MLSCVLNVEIEVSDEFEAWWRKLDIDQQELVDQLAFDPRRTAILLLGGDKRGQWSRWYLEAIPAAERIYARHLGEIERQEGR